MNLIIISFCINRIMWEGIALLLLSLLLFIIIVINIIQEQNNASSEIFGIR